MRRGRPAVVPFVVCAALLAASCSGDGGRDGGRDGDAATTVRPRTTERIGETAPPRSTTTAETTTTETGEREAEDPALLALGALLDDDGVLPVDAALGIVAAVHGDLPGVEPVELGTELPPDAAAAALRRLTDPTLDLDAATAQAVASVLEPADGEEEVELPVGEGRRRAVPIGDGPFSEPTAEELTGIVATVVADIEERTGRALGLPVRARLIGDRATGGDAVTSAVYAGGGDRATACRIALPRGLFGGDAASVTSTIAHEVWHCFQLDESEAAFHSGPLWMIEGQAEWAGEAYVGGSASSASRWDTWLLVFEQSLWRRSYDAIGLYAVAAQQGVDPWTAMLSMLGRGNAGAVEALFGAAPEQAVVAVAQAVVRAPAVGPVWESTGPGITAAAGAPVVPLPLGDPIEARTSAGRFAVLPVVLGVMSGEVARVELVGGVGGAVQLNGSEVVQVGAGGSALFCLRPEGCECPDGSNSGGGDPLPPASPGEGAAAVGTLDAADLAVRASLVRLEDLCRRSLVGTWLIDTGELLPILTAPYGGGAPSCSGPFTLTFGADGSFLGQFTATCTVGESTGTGTGRFTGSYTNDATTVQLLGAVGAGSMEINGVTMPLPFDGLVTGLSSPTPYVLDGDQLTLSITAPDGTTFVVPYTRSA